MCYTFMKQTEYGNGECPIEARSIPVFCAIRPERVNRARTSAHSTANVHRSGFAARCAKGCFPGRSIPEQRKGTGDVTNVTEPVPSRAAE